MDKAMRERRKAGFWRFVSLIAILLAIGFAIALVVISTGNSDSADQEICGEGADNPNDNFIDLSEPDSPGPFHDLTKHEIRKLRAFLEAHPTIKAVPAEGAKISQSVIYMMDLFLAKKADILAHLDEGKPKPPRQARVLMFRGDLQPSMVEEYICGPLPDVRNCDLLVSEKRRNPVEFSLRPFGLMDLEAIYDIFVETDKQLGYILQESFGTTLTNCKPWECFKEFPSPLGTNLVGDINMRRLWLHACYPLEYYSLYPTDFALLVNMDGSDPKKFHVEKIWYNGQIFESADDFIVAYNTSSIEKIKMRVPKNTKFSTLERRGDPLPKKPQRPPRLVEPDGKRYSVKNRRVDYLGWSFNFKMSALTGPSVFDVRYKGERIAFEMSLSEISVFYSGDKPAQRVTDYVDSGALIGSHSKSLVPGADCPETATFINQTFSGQAVDEPVHLDRAFCLFENNNGYPLRRHLSYSQFEGATYGGLQDSVLTLRSIMTIVNYDYVLDFIFHQNGVIETRLMSTGYIMSTYFTDLEKPYGFHIEKDIIGNLHHHMFHFKVDLDIKGASNRYETLDIVPQTVDMKSVPGVKYHQTKYVKNLKKREKDALYKYDFDHPKYHVVHNNAKRTKYDAMSAFRIAMNGMSKQLFPEDVNNERSVPWARHQLVVTRHKDDEVVGSSPYAMWDSLNPVTNFSQFVEDNENIVDEDLVFWISSGLHHIPHTEDLPVTPTVGNHLTFFLLPYNYFDECPSVTSRDQIRIVHKDPSDPKKGVTVDRNGNSDSQCTIPRATTYEEALEENPDIVLETKQFKGIF